MKKYRYEIFMFSIFVPLVVNCSGSNPTSQGQKGEVTTSTIVNKITSGSGNVSAGITETKIINSLKGLDSTKFSRKMYDFSDPNNEKALNDRLTLIEQIKKNPSILQREEVKTLLIDLLNNEVKYSREYYDKTQEGLGEGYGEYEAELDDLVYKYMDKRSLYTEIVLLNDHGDFLTTYWKDSSQLVLQRIKDTPSNGNILNQIAALGKAQKEKHFTLDSETVKSFKVFALTELKSTEFFIREPAVEALQYITTKKDRKIIEALKTVAKSDPYRYGAPIYNERLKKMELYPVREAAQRALEYIEKQ